MVGIVGRVVVAFVTGDAIGWCSGIAVRMASLAIDRQMGALEREGRLVVVEAGGFPAVDRVTVVAGGGKPVVGRVVG